MSNQLLDDCSRELSKGLPAKVFTINSTNSKEEVADAIRSRKWGYLSHFIDPEGQAASQLEVTTVPRLIIVGKDSKIAYHGTANDVSLHSLVTRLRQNLSLHN